jgi:hypothetical protein
VQRRRRHITKEAVWEWPAACAKAPKKQHLARHAFDDLCGQDSVVGSGDFDY